MPMYAALAAAALAFSAPPGMVQQSAVVRADVQMNTKVSRQPPRAHKGA